MKVIDVSAWQDGIDMKQVKAEGVGGVIVKIGENMHETETARTQIFDALDAGLKVGVYYFARGKTVDELTEEANWLVDKLKEIGLTDYHLQLKCWLDYELQDYWNLSALENTNNITAFLNVVNKWLYNCGVYGSYSLLWDNTYLYSRVPWVPIWVAQYSNSCDYPNAKMWQYSESENVAGYTVDANKLYY